MVNTKALLILGGIVLLVVALNPGILKKIIGEDAKYVTCETKLLNILFERVKLIDFQCSYTSKKCIVQGSMSRTNIISNKENDVYIYLIVGESVKRIESSVDESIPPFTNNYQYDTISVCAEKDSTTAKVEIRNKDGVVGTAQDSIKGG